MGERPGVEHHRIARIRRGVDPIQQLGFAVALPDNGFQPELLSLAFDQRDQFNVGGAAVDLRLAAPEPSLHDLRHSHASMLIALDVPVVDVQRRLGHRKPDTTLRVYAHQWKEREARRSQVGQQLGQLFERCRELTAAPVTRLALPPAKSHA